MKTEIDSTENNKLSRFCLIKKIGRIVRTFSLTEKTIFGVLLGIFVISGAGILLKVNNSFLVDVPRGGGTLREGIIGTPRFINPLIAVSTADKDLTSLVFAGLTRKDADGNIVPDLAERYEISEDQLEYRFFLRDDLKFHDGEKLTTDDVVFTVLKAQDPEIASPKRSEWVGVSMEKISDTEIVFHLKQPYGPFLENTTVGILPRHLWEKIMTGGFSLSKYNTEPIGAGPYKLDDIKRDKTDIPESYTLSAFKNYSLGRPFIDKIVLSFVKNEEELIGLFGAGEIDSFGGINPATAKILEQASANILTSPLPRIFGLFFNQNEARILAESAVRRALEVATPKEQIITDVLSGFARSVNGSIPSRLVTDENLSNEDADESDTPEESEETEGGAETEEGAESDESAEDYDEAIATAQSILEKSGWEKNDDGIYEKEKDKQISLLSLSISTNDVPELVETANLVADSWKKIGADVSVKVFEPGDLSQTIIRPRNFEVLLFGMVIHNYPDLYAFWHSSQRIDPGLNITNYANITVDKLLDNLRNLTDKTEIRATIKKFNENIAEDRPAIFLYSPEFIYVLPAEIQGVKFNNITSGEDRFTNIYEWFIETDRVWGIFN
ncbi:MAG TPA: ABC transporter substrate-binding protein [Candidatus Paceibacterota bacterium]|nr:ABC transporter substrate-binding protein [Candidatus Paceibacterota bacterium]HRZ34638.1 ABC transporter substrate-binding protein [Candidatus Paceibacterota bacterium]